MVFSVHQTDRWLNWYQFGSLGYIIKKKNCNLNEIGDEYHFFLKCTASHSLRNNLFNKIILNKPDFIEEIPLNKIKNLLDANSELLAEVGDFIKQSTELQKRGPCRSKVWHVKNIILIKRIYFVYPILWSNWIFLCFLCFVCLYLYLLDPHGCIIMQIKNYIIELLRKNRRVWG
jgi:hypothetical protein